MCPQAQDPGLIVSATFWDREHFAMADRAVYRTAKDHFGNIVGLWGEFGTVGHSDAISDIEHGVERYWVPLEGGAGSVIEVVNGAFGKYLRANWDGKQRNNLTDLPDA